MAHSEQTPSPVTAVSETLRGVVESMRNTAAAAPELDELYTDPETLRRIGVVIATAALRSGSAKY